MQCMQANFLTQVKLQRILNQDSSSLEEYAGINKRIATRTNSANANERLHLRSARTTNATRIHTRLQATGSHTGVFGEANRQTKQSFEAHNRHQMDPSMLDESLNEDRRYSRGMLNVPSSNLLHQSTPNVDLTDLSYLYRDQSDFVFIDETGSKEQQPPA